MIDFTELEQELENTNVIDITREVPYGEYQVRLYNIKCKSDIENEKEKFSAMFQIIQGDFTNCIIWDNYSLSTKEEDHKSRKQLYQYRLLKQFFFTICPKIKWTFQNVDQLKSAIPEYINCCKYFTFYAIYYEDNNGFKRLQLTKNEVKE